MHLPEPNKFIASDLDLKTPADAAAVPAFPAKIASDAGGELFFRPDPVFKRPLAYLQFKLKSAKPLESVK